MIVSTFPLNQNITSHHGIPKGSVGRGGHDIVAVCLHVLEVPMDTYLAYLGTTMNFADVRPSAHGSLHYGIEADGTQHQFVIDTNTAWSVKQLSNPTWALLGDYSGIDVNYLFLNIGIEPFISANIPTNTFRSLAELTARLCELYDIPVDADHIISHDQLDDSYADCVDALAPNLIATVQSLVSQGNTDASTNVAVLAQQVASLQTQVDNLQADVDDALETITTYAAHVTTKAGASTLGHVESSSTVAVDQTSGAASVKTLAASYKVDASNQQPIVANIPANVQFPLAIQDSNTWAVVGVNWKVMPSVAGLYRLWVRIAFAASDWTAGRTIQLDCYKNGLGGGGALLATLSYKVIEANLTSKIVEIAGECDIVVSTLTDFYGAVVMTTDSNGIKNIADGQISISRVGM